MACVSLTSAATGTVLPVRDYDLAATLTSGQAFRWSLRNDAWEGILGTRWVRLRAAPGTIVVETAAPVADWDWLADYLQTDVDLAAVLGTFPPDEPMRAAVAACHGLRLLRQDPWECLASFVLSSTKQIVQIQQIIALLCERFGPAVAVPAGREPQYGFPAPDRLASCTEAELRACKMGFRARYLRAIAQKVMVRDIDLAALAARPVEAARAELMDLPGVGRKIADCVLLFAYGFQAAFPVDVWVMKALRELYFSGRRVTPERLLEFTTTHFGGCAGYAQQYLFHYMRTQRRNRP